ncbi:MAG: hypothetical protein [Circular genetic element sp.]|jgi:hypothetical protein|nr:MAG: hypothetical protein [Circular genetic element sp.]
MMIHPYHAPWDNQHIHGSAHRAAMKRGAFYATAGFIDPRTYTVDPWFIVRGTGMSWSSALGVSMRIASVTGLLVGAVAYMGVDPLNVTPGYGFSPGDSRDRFGREFEDSPWDRPKFSHFIA